MASKAIVKENAPLKDLTWYGLGGNADYLVRPQTVEQLKEIMQCCHENDVPVHVLGFGSNLLVSDEGVRGAVLKLDAPSFCEVKFDRKPH